MKLRLPHKLQAALMAALASVSFTTLSTGSTAYATTSSLEDAELKLVDFTAETMSAATGWTFSDGFTGNESGIYTAAANTCITSSEPWTSVIKDGSANRSIWAGIITVNVNTLPTGAQCLLEDASGTARKEGMGVGTATDGSKYITGVAGTTYDWGHTNGRGMDISLANLADANGNITLGIFYYGTGTSLYVADQQSGNTGLKNGVNDANLAMYLSSVAGVQYTNLFLFGAASTTEVSDANMKRMLKDAGAYYWTGSANGNWNATDTNWTHYGSSVAVAIGANGGNANTNVVFGADASNKNVNLAGATTVGALTISGGDYTFNLNGNNLTTGTITIAEGASLAYTGSGAVSGTLAGAGALVVNNAGNTVTVNGTDNYTGAITVNAGTLELTSTVNAGAVTVAPGATLKLSSGGNLVSSGALTLTGATLDVTAMSFRAGSSYTLATAGAGVSCDNVTLNYTLPSGATNYTLSSANNALTLSFDGERPADPAFHVYILTGQSNSQGAVYNNPASSEQLAAYASHAIMWNGNFISYTATPPTVVSTTEWSHVEPQQPVYTNLCMGPEYGFSYMMEKFAAEGVVADLDGLGIIKASLNGGGNQYWVPGSATYNAIYNSVVAALEKAIADGKTNITIDGLLYLQGESNGDGSTEAGTKYLTFKNTLSADLQAWLATQDTSVRDAITIDFADNTVLGQPSQNKGDTDARQQETAGTNTDKNGIGYLYTSDLGGSMRASSSTIHFGGSAQLVIGARYAYAFAVQNGLNVGAVRSSNKDQYLDNAMAWWMEKLPETTDVVKWDLSSVSVSGGNQIQSSLTVGGIKVEDPYNTNSADASTVYITGGTLSVGSSGIELEKGGLSIASAFNTTAAQTWKIAAGKTLEIGTSSASVAFGGAHTVTIAEQTVDAGAGSVKIHASSDAGHDFVLQDGAKLAVNASSSIWSQADITVTDSASFGTIDNGDVTINSLTLQEGASLDFGGDTCVRITASTLTLGGDVTFRMNVNSTTLSDLLTLTSVSGTGNVAFALTQGSAARSGHEYLLVSGWDSSKLTYSVSGAGAVGAPQLTLRDGSLYVTFAGSDPTEDYTKEWVPATGATRTIDSTTVVSNVYDAAKVDGHASENSSSLTIGNSMGSTTVYFFASNTNGNNGNVYAELQDTSATWVSAVGHNLGDGYRTMGGSYNVKVSGTQAAAYTGVFGAVNATVDGNVYLELDNANATYNTSSDKWKSVNGGFNAQVGGSMTIVVAGGTFTDDVTGGFADGASSNRIEGGVYMQVDGGTFKKYVLGGNRKTGTINNGVHMVINNGTFEDYVFAGNNGTSKTAAVVNGGADLVINGGTFKKGIYAAGFTGTVNGGVNLTIRGGSFTAPIYVGSGSSNAVTNGVMTVNLEDINNDNSFASYTGMLNGGSGGAAGESSVTGHVLNLVDFTASELKAQIAGFDEVNVTKDSATSIKKSGNASTFGGAAALQIDGSSVLTLDADNADWDAATVGMTVEAGGTLQKTGSYNLALGNISGAGTVKLAQGTASIGTFASATADVAAGTTLTVNLPGADATLGTLRGAGTVQLNGALSGTAANMKFALGSDWTGTVKLTAANIKDTGNVVLNLNNFGRAGSTIELDGVGSGKSSSGGDYLYQPDNAVVDANLMLTGNFTLTAGGSNMTYTFNGDWSGSGNFENTYTGFGNYAIQLNGNMKDYSGTITVHKGQKLNLGSGGIAMATFDGGSASGTGVINGAGESDQYSDVTVNYMNAVTLGSTFQGALNLVVNTNQEAALTKANTYTGTTVVQSGSLAVRGDGTLGKGQVTIKYDTAKSILNLALGDTAVITANGQDATIANHDVVNANAILGTASKQAAISNASIAVAAGKSLELGNVALNNVDLSGHVNLTSSVTADAMVIKSGSTFDLAGQNMITVAGKLTLESGSTLDLARIFETQEEPVQNAPLRSNASPLLLSSLGESTSALSVDSNLDSGLSAGGLLGAATPVAGDYILATANDISLADNVNLLNIAEGYTGSLSTQGDTGNKQLILTLAAASSDLIWDNHAETDKWNTTDDNWHVGTATAGSSKFQTNDDVKFTKATNGQTVTLDGDITAGNITIEQGADITIKDDNHRLTGTLKGSGTYALDARDKTLPTGLTLDPTDWVGTVRLTDVTQNALDFSQYVNGNLSTLELKGFTGWSNPWRGDINQNIKLTNTDTDGSAWVNGAYSGDTNHKAIFGGTWSGTGTFERTGGSTMDYEYTGNISDWTGMFKMNAGGGTTVLSFSDAADTVNAEIKQTAGTLNLELKQDTTFNKNVTVSKIAGADYTMTLGSTDGTPANLTVTGTQNTLGGLNFTGGKHTVNLNGGATNATVATIGSISGEADINITSGNGNRTYNLTGDLSGWTGTLTQTATSGSMNLNISGTNELNADIVNTTGASNCTLALNLAHNMDVNGQITYSSSGPVNVNVGDSSNEVVVNFTNTVKAGSVNVVNNSTATFQNNVTATTLYQKGGTINIGDANHHVVVNTGRVEAGDSNTSRDSSAINVAAGSLLNVTGSSDGSGSNPYKDASLLLGEWGIPTTVNVAGSLVAANAQALVGDKGFTATIAADGVMAVKGIGICRVNDSKEQSVGITLQEGGKLILGSSGITADKNSNYQLSAGEIGISADNVAITPGMELNSAEGTTFNTAKYTIGTDGTITEGTVGGSLTISGALSGTGKLVKDGAGTLNLNTANTYAGGTEVNAGTLVVGSDGALGSGTTTVNSGGTLELTSTVSTLNNTISIAQGGTLALGNYKDNAVTIGTLTLGDNSILDLSALNISGAETTPITLIQSGTIDETYLSSVDIKFADGVEPENYTLSKSGDKLVLTFAQTSKNLIWDNNANTNSWTGDANWHTATDTATHIAFTDGDNVQFTSTPAKPNPTLGADVSAGTMQIDTGVEVTVNTGANKLTVADLDSTGGSLTVGGTGSATFGGSDDEVTLSELQITGGNVVFNEHVHVTGNNSIQPRGNSNVTFEKGISFDGQGGGYGYAMIIKSGSSATLGGTTSVPNKYIGPEANTTLTLAQGAEVTARGVRNSTKLSSNGNVVLEDGATLITRDGGVYTPNLTLNGTSSVTLGGNSQLGAVSGSGDLIVNAGTLNLGGANTGFTGDVTVNGGTIELANSKALGAANTAEGAREITINADGAIDLKGYANECYVYTLSGGTLKNTGGNIGDNLKQTAGLVLTEDSYVSGTGNFHVINSDYKTSKVTLNGNTLTKTGSNTVGFYTTEFDAGTLEVRDGALDFNSGHLSTFKDDITIKLNDSAAGNENKLTGKVNVDKNLTLDTQESSKVSLSTALQNASSSLTADVAAEKTLTMSGAVTGSGSLVKSGEGTLVLTNGNNSYAGTTTVNGGTLVAGEQGALGGGLVTVNDGGTLQLTSSVSSVGSLDVKQGGTLTFAGYDDSAITATALTLASGSILDVSQLGLTMGAETTITLVKGGCGSTVTSGVEVFFGDAAPDYTLSVQGNDLMLTYTPVAGALIWDNNTGNQNWSLSEDDKNWHTSGAPHGSSFFEQNDNVIFAAGDSTAALQQDITAGKMTVQNDADVTVVTNDHNFSASINLSDGGSVTFDTDQLDSEHRYTDTVTGTITGAGDIHKDGNGTLVLDVTNTNTGSLVIDDGTVQVSSAAALGELGNRDVVVNLGGALALAPGDTYELDTLTLDLGSTLKFSGAVAPGDTPLLDIGTLNWTSNSSLDFSNIDLTSTGTYVLAHVDNIVASETGLIKDGIVQFIAMKGMRGAALADDHLVSLHYSNNLLTLQLNGPTEGFYWKPDRENSVWDNDFNQGDVQRTGTANWGKTGPDDENSYVFNNSDPSYGKSAYFLDAGEGNVENITVDLLGYVLEKVNHVGYLHDFIIAGEGDTYNFTAAAADSQLHLSTTVLSNFVVRKNATANFDGVDVSVGEYGVMHICEGAEYTAKNITNWATYSINNEGTVSVDSNLYGWDAILGHVDNTGELVLHYNDTDDYAMLTVGQMFNREGARMVISAPTVWGDPVGEYGDGILHNEGELIFDATGYKVTGTVSTALPIHGTGTFESAGPDTSVILYGTADQSSMKLGAHLTDFYDAVTIKDTTELTAADITAEDGRATARFNASSDLGEHVVMGANTTLDLNTDTEADPVYTLGEVTSTGADQEVVVRSGATANVEGVTSLANGSVSVETGAVYHTAGNLTADKVQIAGGGKVIASDAANTTNELAATGSGTAVVELNGKANEGNDPVLAAKKLTNTDSTALRVVNTETGTSGRVAKFDIGDADAAEPASSYQGTLQYGVGANAANGSGMDLTIKDDNVAAGAVLEAYYDTQAPANGSVNIFVDTENAKVAGLSDNINGPDANRAMKVSGATAGNSLEITGDGDYVYAGKLGENLNIAYTGDGSQTIEGGVENFRGSITVNNDNPANDSILSIQNAASVDITNLTIGSNDKLEIQKGSNVGTAEVSGNVVALGGPTTGSSGTASVLNGNLTLGSGSTYDVSAAEGQGGLDLNGALTITKGAVSLSDDDWAAVGQLDWFGMYDLAFDVTSLLGLGEGIDWSEGVDATTVFSNTGLRENEYYVRYSGVGTAGGNGNNVGAVYIYRIPEPTTSTLSLLALCALAARRRRK